MRKDLPRAPSDTKEIGGRLADLIKPRPFRTYIIFMCYLTLIAVNILGGDF